MTRPTKASRMRRPARVALVLGAGLAVISGSLALVLAVWPGGGSHPHVALASGAHAAVDPRLILRARATGVGGMLAGGVYVSGTLYPALPGPNTLRLTLRRTSGATLLPAGQVRAVVTMPGMAMPPVAATLTAHGRSYAGAIRLPMFGAYRARLVVRTPAGRYTGAVAVTVPLDVTAIAHRR